MLKKYGISKKNLCSNIPDRESHPVFEHINDMCAATLCDKTSQKISCLNRNCADCGMSKLSYHADKSDDSKTACKVKWETFEYTKINVKGGKTRTKLMLVTKETNPGEMFRYMKYLLETFPSPQHRANWQREQCRNIVQNLPINYAVLFHDYSENHRCSDRTEIQSNYFQRAEVSIYASILHRHAILEVDGVDSIPESLVIVSEQVFVISPDLDHGRSSRVMFKLKFLIICSQYLRISRLCTNLPTGVARNIKSEIVWAM